MSELPRVIALLTRLTLSPSDTPIANVAELRLLAPLLHDENDALVSVRDLDTAQSHLRNAILDILDTLQ